MRWCGICMCLCKGVFESEFVGKVVNETLIITHIVKLGLYSKF